MLCGMTGGFALCKTNGFSCTFHDPRHTFITMMVAGGCDVRTVTSYLGHASVSMTLDLYADVDPEAKRAAVGKVDESLDAETGGCGGVIMGSVIDTPKHHEPASPPQRRRRLLMGVFKLIWRFGRWLFRAASRWM